MDRETLRRSLALILGGTLTSTLSTGFAFNMGNMMNPSQWMGGDGDRDYYEAGPWGGPGYGYGDPTADGASPAAAGGQSEIDALGERIRVLEVGGVR
jgi:hypothetical protein